MLRPRPGCVELPAVDVLRRVLVQNYVITTNAAGREVVRAREADTDGLPPGRTRLSSPYDLDARWAAKGDDVAWNGYKVHITETCCDPPDPTPTGRPDTDRRQTRPVRTRPVRTQPVERSRSERGRGAAEHHHRGGHHGRDRAGRRDDREDPRHAGRAGTAARPALPRLGLPVCGAGRRQPAPLGGQPGHPAAGRPVPAGPRRRRVRPGQLHHRLRHPAGHLPAGPELHLVEPGHPTRHRRHRDQVRGRHLPTLPGPRPVHPLHLHQVPAAS